MFRVFMTVMRSASNSPIHLTLGARNGAITGLQPPNAAHIRPRIYGIERKPAEPRPPVLMLVLRMVPQPATNATGTPSKAYVVSAIVIKQDVHATGASKVGHLQRVGSCAATSQ
jgi:hypothetical protein